MKEYKRPHRKDEWTTQETQLLRDIYPSTNYILEEIRKKLPNRTPNAIRLKASRLGLHRPFTLRWTPNSILSNMRPAIEGG